jgi:hypothetical protein
MPEEQLRALIAKLKHDMGPMGKPKGPADHLDEAVVMAKGAGFDDRKVKQLTHETRQPFERINKEFEVATEESANTQDNHQRSRQTSHKSNNGQQMPFRHQ